MEPLQCRTFNFTKENVDEIFELLLLNKNSISSVFECYSRPIADDHNHYDVVRLIEKCSNSIRNGCKSSDDYWDNEIKDIEKKNHYIRKIEQGG